METRAIRLYGENDLRLDTFELPEIKEDQILVKIITDSVCMSTYKLSKQGERHARVPGDLSKNPAIVGHEMAGIIVEIGDKWKDKYEVGSKFTVQPVMEEDENGVVLTAGYSFPMYGGDSTYSILHNEVMEGDYLIPFHGESFFEASLAEPVACIVCGYNVMFHTNSENHEHTMGTKKGGYQVILGACGPMGLECTDYALQNETGADVVVAVDINEERLKRAERMLMPRAKDKKLIFVNPNDHEDVIAYLMSLTDGHGYDDAFVYAPIQELIEQADKLLAKDGCMNFFAGPVDKSLSAYVNFYDIHYASTHMVGSSGSTKQDLLDTLKLMEEGRIQPTVMVTHIGGLESAIHTTMNVPNIPGGKKLIYTHVDLPLTAIDDFRELGKENELFEMLADSCDAHNGCWNAEAEKILLDYYQVDTTK